HRHLRRGNRRRVRRGEGNRGRSRGRLRRLAGLHAAPDQYHPLGPRSAAGAGEQVRGPGSGELGGAGLGSARAVHRSLITCLGSSFTEFCALCSSIRVVSGAEFTPIQNEGTRSIETEIHQPPRAGSRTPVRIIGVACGAGAPDPRCAEGPATLRREGLVRHLRGAGVDAAWSATIPAQTGNDAISVILPVAERLAAHAGALVAREQLPLVLGG